MDWRTVIGAVIILWVAYVLYSGRIPFSNRYGGSSMGILRSERPIAYWARVVSYLVMAALLFLKIFPSMGGS